MASQAAPPVAAARPILQLLGASDYEAEARRLLPTAVHDYFAGGAEDERAMEANRRAFEALYFIPRVLVPVGNASTRLPRICLKGALSPGEGSLQADFSLPIIIAPMAMQRLAHKDGELAMTHAARNFGIPMCLSTLATESIERVGQIGGTRLFQLYIYRDRDITLELVRRASATGFSALVLTVDAPVFGRRERDMRNGFTLPPDMTLANFCEPKKSSMNSMKRGTSGLAAYGAGLLDPNMTWKDVEWLVREAGMPVWAKGVMHPDDALRAVEVGVKAIVVSNHGGRQLDSVCPTLDALPAIVAAVGKKVPVLVDSGIRRGSDIAKALALGATCVMVGRPLLWALAVDGQAGVERMLHQFHEELRVTLMLVGVRNVSALSSCCLGRYAYSRAAV